MKIYAKERSLAGKKCSENPKAMFGTLSFIAEYVRFLSKSRCKKKKQNKRNNLSNIQISIVNYSSPDTLTHLFSIIVLYVENLYHKANDEAKAVYYTVIKHSGYLRTLEKCRKHSFAARVFYGTVFYISLVFSNDRRVLSQCNTRRRLLYVLNITRRHQVRKRSPSAPWCSQHWDVRTGYTRARN